MELKKLRSGKARKKMINYRFFLGIVLGYYLLLSSCKFQKDLLSPLDGGNPIVSSGTSKWEYVSIRPSKDFNVRAIEDCMVVNVYSFEGLSTVIAQGKYRSVYGSFDTVYVKPGIAIKKGSIIGELNKLGSQYLDFSLFKNEKNLTTLFLKRKIK